MFDTNEIMNRLRAGEDPETLAAEMADALNAATTALKEEQKEADAQEYLADCKREAAAHIIDALCHYLSVVGEEEYLQEVDKLDEDKLVRLLDSSIEMAKKLEEVKSLEFPLWFM